MRPSHQYADQVSLRASGARHARLLLAGLVLLTLIVLVFACSLGSVAIPLSDMFPALLELLHGEPNSLAASLLSLRLTRAFTAMVTGGSLALAGVMMQALLRNPLADPYVLGISGGASVGALAALFFFGVSWLVDLAAFGGAISVAALLFMLAYRDLRGMSSGSVEGNSSILLLTGVIIAAGCGALITLMLSIAADGQLRGMVFWMIGDLSSASTRFSAWLILALSFIFAVRSARAMNVAAMHADHAATLGIRIGSLRQSLFLSASLLTASAVSGAGSIGFVGLIIPHACRFAFGADHRVLIPAATLLGGAFLVFADTLARTLVAPQQLPVGVITALIGVPVFLLQLHQLRVKR
jgi:iron complex transport system permease protein